jgi:hypothetical protein
MILIVRKANKGPFDIIVQLLHKPLLHILHVSRFYGNNSRCLQRLRYCDNPHGYLSARFEKVNIIEVFRVIPVTREKEIPGMEHTIKPHSPSAIVEFLVRNQSIGGSSRTMFGDNALVVDIFIYLLHHRSKQEIRYLVEGLHLESSPFRIESPDLLLTLDIVPERLLHPSIAAWEENLTKHQRKLTNGQDGFRDNIVEKLARIPIKDQM